MIRTAGEKGGEKGEKRKKKKRGGDFYPNYPSPLYNFYSLHCYFGT